VANTKHDDVATIRNLLESYEAGFSILKELIQNAKDAEATKIEVSIIPDGFANADHELLKRHPSLLVYNDGKFTEENNRNIHNMAGGSKIEDSTAIGKFGLGLKSVFHLCDMFFYAAKISEGIHLGKIVKDFFNPWENEVNGYEHSNYDSFSHVDEKELEQYFKERYEKGFLLVLPLKTNNEKSHVMPGNLYPDNIYFFGNPNLIKIRIDFILPLLNYIAPTGKKINSITFEGLENGYPEIINFRNDNSSYFKIVINENFYKDYSENFKRSLKLGNNKIEAALTVTKLDAYKENFLTIYYAAYLPLESQKKEISLYNKTKRSYALLLHAPFAIDAGRTGGKYFEVIDKTEGDEFDSYISRINTESEKEYHDWNRRISTEILFPNLLKIIEDAIIDNILEKDDIEIILGEIKQAFSKQNEKIVSIYNLACVLQNNITVWKTFSAKEKVYIIPSFHGGLSFNDIFSNKFDDGIVVVFNSPNDKNYYFLSENCFATIKMIIENFRTDIFKREMSRKYLYSYINLIEKRIAIDDFISLVSRFDSEYHHLFLDKFVNNQEISPRNIIMHDKSESISIIPIYNVTDDERTYISLRRFKDLYNSKSIFLVGDNDNPLYAKLFQIFTLRSDLYIIKSYDYSNFKNSFINSLPNSNKYLITNNIDCLSENIGFVDFSDFSAQLSELFMDISNEKFCRLPIHRTKSMEKKLQSIPFGKTYRGSHNRVPDIINMELTFIGASQNDIINTYENKFIHELDKTECIKLYFRDIDTVKNLFDFNWILNNLDNNAIQQDNDFSKMLKTKKWIPVLENRKFVFPSDIFSPDIVNAGAILVLRDNYGVQNIFTESDIDRDFRDKIKSTGILRGNTKENFLKKLLNNYDDYALTIEATWEELEHYANILSKIDNIPSLNIFKLLSILYRNLNEERDKENIFYLFYNNIPEKNNLSTENYLEILKSISELSINNPNDPLVQAGDPYIINLFCLFLDKILNFDDFSIKNFSEFSFPVQSGIWQKARNIIYDISEEKGKVSNNNRLKKEVNEILRRHLDKLRELDKTQSYDEESPYLINTNTGEKGKISDYFSSWCVQDGQIDRNLIGLFLYISRYEFLEVAEDSFNVDSGMRDIIDSQLAEMGVNVSLLKNKKIDFKVRIYLKNELPDISLTGEFNSFIDYFHHQIEFSFPTTYIFFTKTTTDIDNNDIKELIRDFLVKAYSCNGDDLEQLFMDVMDSSRIYLEKTQEIILKDIFSTLKYLSLLNEDCFKQKFLEFHSSEWSNDLEKSNKINKEIMEQILSGNNRISCQSSIREAVRKRIRQCHYDENSVYFELFQNADDAFIDRINNEKLDNGTHAKFIINHSDKKIVISHFGREINRTYSKNPDSPFRFDLENMLNLNISYKESDKNKTGKFGLGFKTVYLICNEPIIRSRELQVKIVGSFYPELLENSFRKKLSPHETQIELNLPERSVENINKTFCENAVFLAIFSKSIRHIVVNDENNTENNFEIIWNPETQIDASEYSLYRGKIFDDNYLKLMFKNLNNASILFKHDINNNIALPINNDKISKIWNITPLNNDKSLDFAINADFQVDIGRKTVVQDDYTKDLIRNIGECFGKVLYDLFEKQNKKALVVSIFDIIIPAVRRGNEHILMDLPNETIKKFYFCSSLLPNGYNEIVDSSNIDAIYICPEDANYTIDPNSIFALNAALKKRSKCYITWQAYECWREIYEIKNVLIIKNMFDLLEHENNDEYSPEELNNFSEIYKYFIIKTGRKKEQFSLGSKFENYLNEYIPLLYRLEDDQGLEEILSNEYSKESIKLIDEYYEYDYRYKKNDPNRIIVNIGPDAENGDSLSINDMYNWWNSPNVDKEGLIKKYRQSIFPDWYSPNDLNNEDETKFRGSWLALFILALCQQMGRYRNEQHKGFLNLLKNKGWFDQMVNHNESDTWCNIIKEFFKSNNADQEYYEWFKLIPQIYIIKLYFEDYIHILIKLPCIPNDKHYDLPIILTPDINPELTGSGITAPALNRSLKFGASFIIRELLMYKIIKCNSNLIEHAFMPKENIRGYFMENECSAENISSKKIFDSIKEQLGSGVDLTFNNCYDIPMILYSGMEDDI
jgi:hypothetical protein